MHHPSQYPFSCCTFFRPSASRPLSSAVGCFALLPFSLLYFSFVRDWMADARRIFGLWGHRLFAALHALPTVARLLAFRFIANFIVDGAVGRMGGLGWSLVFVGILHLAITPSFSLSLSILASFLIIHSASRGVHGRQSTYLLTELGDCSSSGTGVLLLWGASARMHAWFRLLVRYRTLFKSSPS
ncbi:hypothetical protein HDK77DRAFT_455719, partial [Phyllosticta capitalensis]